MKIRPLNASERQRLQRQFPSVFTVFVAAESLAARSVAHEDALLRNLPERDLDKFVESESKAVDRVTRLVKLMQEGE